VTNDVTLAADSAAVSATSRRVAMYYRLTSLAWQPHAGWFYRACALMLRCWVRLSSVCNL